MRLQRVDGYGNPVRLAAAAATVAMLLMAGQASAEIVVASDAGTAAYGDANGFRIDFDSTFATAADWTPDLTAGQAYQLNSVSVRYGGAQANATPKYLGVYTGLTGGVLSGFRGVSSNTVDFSTAVTGDWQQFNFSGIDVTTDSTVGSGSGLLYFVYQTGAEALTGLETTVSTQRFDGFPSTEVTADYLANILAFGTVQIARAPEYQASLTAAVPEPMTAGLIGIPGALFLLSRRRRG